MDAPLRGVTLALTSACNLACGYCYQRGTPSRTLAAASAHRALDHLFRRSAGRPAVEFSGGEPLLERRLLLELLERLCPPEAGRAAEVVVTTNGLLLDEELLERLEEARAVIALSFDGAGAAQDLRSPGSAVFLERLLQRLRTDFPRCLERLRVHAVVTRRTAALLVTGVGRLLDLGVNEIRLQPAFGDGEAVDPSVREALDAGMEALAEISGELWKRSGRLPLACLRLGEPPGAGSAGPCSASTGEGLFVDPDGVAWTCPLFAASVARPPPAAAAASAAARVGSVDDPAFGARLDEGRARAAGEPLLRRGPRADPPPRCADCADRRSCRVCPAAFAHAGGFPHFACAFERAAALGRRRLEASAGPVPGPALRAAALRIALDAGRDRGTGEGGN